MKIDPNKVRAANKKFFDAVADVYEEVDGRRTEELPEWLLKILKELAESSPSGPFLEIGCGTGWLLQGAGKFYQHCFGTDISHRILPHAMKRSQGCVCSQAEAGPFQDSSFSTVALFATLHHLPEWKPVILEAYRILKPGGWLYTDHDIDSVFLHRFNLPLKIYRGIRKAHLKYSKACPEVDSELYFLSEFHEKEGVIAEELEKILRQAGFKHIHIEWHWLGVHPFFDFIGRIVGTRLTAGLAPNLRILAQK